MIITSNIKEVAGKLKTILQKLADKDALLRTVATSLLTVVHDRIHVKGQAADGTQIGTYTPNYLIRREKKYHRSADPTKILSLTRQMENDFSVQITSDGKYGLGFNNNLNTQKAGWQEEQTGKKIYALTDGEKDLANQVAQQHVKEILSAVS